MTTATLPYPIKMQRLLYKLKKQNLGLKQQKFRKNNWKNN